MNQSILNLKGFKAKTGIHFCSDHYGKMKGLFSINTSPLDNPFCIRRNEKPLSPDELEGYPVVCRDCYSSNLFKMRKTNDACGRRNSEILNAAVIPISEWPTVFKSDFPYGRIEAFGDTKSWVQQANYFQLAASNPDIRFGDWTKNPWFITEAIDHGYSIPNNCEIVLSSLRENRHDDPKKYPFVNKVFTVYSLAWLLKHDKDETFINCGGRSCLKCGKCYMPTNPKDPNVEFINGRPVLFINEIRKQDQKKPRSLVGK